MLVEDISGANSLARKIEALFDESLPPSNSDEGFADRMVALQVCLARQLAAVPNADYGSFIAGAVMVGEGVLAMLDPAVRGDLMQGRPH